MAIQPEAETKVFCDSCNDYYEPDEMINGVCSECYAEGQDLDPADLGDEADFGGDSEFSPAFHDPGGESALRVGTLEFPCPTCKEPNRLTQEDVNLGYQCDSCAEQLERGY